MSAGELAAFAEWERAGWERAAACYAACFAELTRSAAVAWSLYNLVFQSRPASVHTELLKVTIAPDGSIIWSTEPYLIQSGTPHPESSRRVMRGTGLAPS